MVFGDSKHAVDLNRSRSLPHGFSSFSSSGKAPVPKKVGSLAKILSWFSFKGRNRNAGQTAKKRTLHHLIAKIVKKGKTKKRCVLNSSDTKFLCVPSLYLYEGLSKGSFSSRSPSWISRRTASDANISYKSTYEKTTQNCLIPLKDKIGCYYAVVVDGKQYSLGDFFVKATNEDGILETENKVWSPELENRGGRRSLRGIRNEPLPRDGPQLNNYSRKIDFETKKMMSKSTKSNKKSFERGDEMSSRDKPNPRPDVVLYPKRKYSTRMFQSGGLKPKQRSMLCSKKHSLNMMENVEDEQPNMQERIIVQNVIESGRFNDEHVPLGEQSSCCVLKKNSVHKTNLARLGTNLEAAHLKKLKAFIRTHRIDSGKLEFKERLALQWVENKGGRMSSVLEKRGRGSQGLSTQKGFSQDREMRVEPPVSRFVPHFPQNRKFVYEMKPARELGNYRLPELPDRHQEPQIISSFSQETLPMDSLFIPHTGPKSSQEAVKMMSNLWDLRKEKQTECYVDNNGGKTQSWNFKVAK